MTDSNSPPPEELYVAIQSIRTRLRALFVAVVVMALALILAAGAMFGSLVNYFAGDAMMFGGVSVLAALLGFAFGWIARGKA